MIELNILDNTILAERYFPGDDVIKSHYEYIHTRNLAKVIKSTIQNINENDIVAFVNNSERDLFYNGSKYIILKEENVYAKICDQ